MIKTLILFIAILVISSSYNIWADEIFTDEYGVFHIHPIDGPAETPILDTSYEEYIFDLDDIDYFIYKGRRLTLSGVINAIIEEKKGKIITELIRIFKKEE